MPDVKDKAPGRDSKKIASLGGVARKEALSKERRVEIAKKGAFARHTAKLPVATHEGPLKIGDIELACSVLATGEREGDGEIRVFSTRGVSRAFGSKKTGAEKNPADSGAPRIPAFLSTSRIFPFLSAGLIARLNSPLEFRPMHGGRTAFGYEATILPEICEALLDARKRGGLSPKQLEFAETAETMLRAFARVGVIALVDEATGFQATRDRNALQAILDAYLRQELAAWAKRFPDEFYQQIFRLRGWEWKGMHVNRPQVVAAYTKDFVYARLAPGVLAELEKRLPIEEGRRKGKFHQLFTDDVGHPALAQHLHAVIGLMRASTTWDHFIGMIDVAFPARGDTLSMPFMADPPQLPRT